MNRFLRCASTVAAAAFSLFAAAPQASAQPTSQPAERAADLRFDVRYLQLLPPGYNADPMNAKTGDGKGWPLVLFLHGAGERSDDLNVLKTQGLPRLAAQSRQFPFILIMPQVEKGGWWNPQVLSKLLDECERTLRVDPDRIYVTGLSMGGFGTWDLVRTNPRRFAAIAPICGGGDPWLVGRLGGEPMKSLPVWAFHGDADDIVPLSRTVEMVEALRSLGNRNVRITIYPGVGHDSWTQAYDDPELYRWLLSHKRGQPATQPTMPQP